jgi:hypothetical protein
MDYSSGGYRLTPSGWSLADQLWKLKILDALEPDALKSDEELSNAVGLTDGPAELDELRRLLKRIASGRHGCCDR